MDSRKNQKVNPFPQGYEYIGEIIKEPIKKIQELNKRIENFSEKPFEKIVLRLTPPGMGNFKQSDKFKQTVNSLERLREKHEKELDERVAVEIKMLDPETANLIKNAIYDLRNPSKFDDKSEVEMEAFRIVPKDLDNSQDYAQQLLHNSRAELVEVDNSKFIIPDIHKSEIVDVTIKTPRFSDSLRHIRFKEKSENSRDICSVHSTINIDKDIDT